MVTLCTHADCLILRLNVGVVVQQAESTKTSKQPEYRVYAVHHRLARVKDQTSGDSGGPAGDCRGGRQDGRVMYGQKRHSPMHVADVRSSSDIASQQHFGRPRYTGATGGTLGCGIHRRAIGAPYNALHRIATQALCWQALSKAQKPFVKACLFLFPPLRLFHSHYRRPWLLVVQIPLIFLVISLCLLLT